jgi:hypothetical protein
MERILQILFGRTSAVIDCIIFGKGWTANQTSIRMIGILEAIWREGSETLKLWCNESTRRKVECVDSWNQVVEKDLADGFCDVVTKEDGVAVQLQFGTCSGPNSW